AVHSGFFAGAAGGAAVGILALFLLFSVITGIYMWWPRGRWHASLFRMTAKVHSRAFLGQLHSVSGLYISLLLGLAAVTGFHSAFQPLTTKALAAILPMAGQGQSQAMTGAMQMDGAMPAIDTDGAVARAKKLFPQRPLKSLMRMGREHP